MYVCMYIYILYIFIYQVLAYEKRGRATIAYLALKFIGYRRAKSHTPLTKWTCGGVRLLSHATTIFLNTIVLFPLQ